MSEFDVSVIGGVSAGSAVAGRLAEDPRRAQAIAEGALLRLRCGAACFARYRLALMT